MTLDFRHRSASRAWGAVAGAILAACMIGGPSEAHGETAIGFSEAAQYDKLSPDMQARSLQLEAAAGGHVHRTVLSWKSVEPVRSVFDWTYYDRVIGSIRAAGMRPLITIAHAPRWAHGFLDCEGSNCPPGNEHLDDWARFAYQVALRYPDAYAIEVWNEPNIWGQWSTLNGPDPERYAQVLNTAAGAIHAANPSIRVLGGAVTYWPAEDGRRRMTMPTFLERFYRAGGARELRPQDGLSIHAYPWINELETLDGQFKTILGQARTAIARFDPGRQIFITETGVTTTGPWAVSEKQQARGLLTLVTKVPKMANVHSLLIHAAVQPPYDRQHPHEIGYGLLERQTLNPGKAFCALAENAGTTPPPGGCAPGVLADIGWSTPDPGGGGDGGGEGGDGDTATECELRLERLKARRDRLRARRAVYLPYARAGHRPSRRAVRRINGRLAEVRVKLRRLERRCG